MKLIVSAERNGERIDVFLTGQEGVPTRSFAQKLLAIELVKINDKPVAKNYKVAAGDEIHVTLPEPKPYEAVPMEIPLDIIYEDAHLLVINKQRGLVVHPAAGNWDGTLVNALMFHCKGELSGIGGVMRPGIVHRLDKDTSGLMVVAKSDAAHIGLSAQLADKTMSRIYNAVCIGNFPHEKLKIDAPIGRHPVNRQKMAVTPTGGKTAVTLIQTLERFSKHTLVSAQLTTGRTHQIRVHLSHVGYPVLGDEIYGRGSSGQILHARELSFVHPVTGEKMTFATPLPEYFANVLDALQK